MQQRDVLYAMSSKYDHHGSIMEAYIGCYIPFSVGLCKFAYVRLWSLAVSLNS
jgi:hypothetical protein